MSKQKGKNKRGIFAHNIETCTCLKCRVTRLEIVVEDQATTIDDILIPFIAQNLQKEGKVLIKRPDGRYAVGTIPKPTLTKHPETCTCQLCVKCSERK